MASFSPRCSPFGLAFLLGLSCLSPGCRWDELSLREPAAVVGTLPTRWTGGGPAIPGEAVTGWLDDFGDPKLRLLVEEAVGANFDLNAARARIGQARERVRGTAADRFPSVDTSFGASRSEALRGATFQSVRSNNFDLSLNFAWEVDLWGRLGNLQGAQLDRFHAATNLYHAARLSLAANVSKTAFAIVESRQQISLAERTLASLRTNLDILDDKLEAGAADDGTALEISLSRADIARARSRVLAEQRQIDSSKRTLETLLGRYPAGEIEAIASMPRLSREVPTGLPSELLLRRPDLLAAEAQVDAAMKELVASRKALLPAVRITSGLGTSSTDNIGDVFDIQNMVWNVGENLTRPVFQGGALRSAIRLDEHEKHELIETYASTALTAFREVETALAGERYLAAQEEALRTAAVESRRAEDLSLGQYEQGLVEIITLLESQRRAFDAESALYATQLELLYNRVDLYLALGGDFDHLLPEAAPSE